MRYTNKSIYFIVIVLCLLLLCVIPSVNATNSVNLSWNRTFDYCVTALDTNSQGTLIFVGLGNGTILAYDNLGNVSWAYATNSSSPSDIKEIVTDISGNLIWRNIANQTGYISSTGTIAGLVDGSGRNITDIAISGDGGTYVTTELNPPRITVRTSNGTIIVQNTSYGNVSTIPTRWIALGYDPSKSWLVTANESSNTLYFWNLSTWTGWEEFNPTHSAVKSPNQTFIDSFPYRQNISIDGVLGKELRFYNTTNTTYIQKLNNSYYEYNAINTGNYFYWTRSGYENESQIGLLSLSWINSSNYYIALNPGYSNYTIYYGLLNYNNTINNASYFYNSRVINVSGSSGTFSIPLNATVMKYFVVGGGGGGGSNKGGSGTNGTNLSGTLYVNNATSVFYYYIGSGGGNDANGVASTLSNASVTLTAAGGLTRVIAGNGQNGTNTVQFVGPITFLRGGTGTTANPVFDGVDACQTLAYDYGYYGGYGYGGGGGSGGNGGGCSNGYGGTGVGGVINVTFSSFTTPIYTNSYLFSQQTRSSASSLNQTSSKTYVGNVLGLSVPRSGGIMSIITDTIFYQQYMTSTGFGLTYCATLSSGYPALFAGTPHSVAASNSGSASVEGRGAYGNIYDAGGVAKASVLTGGDIRASDSAMTSGTIAAFGGDDGKLYILSREGSVTWYTYYTGTADTQINDISVSWDGTAVTVGRFDGKLEYYITNYNTTSNGTTEGGSSGGGVVIIPPSVTVYVFKDGAPYPNQPITIYTSETQTNFVPIKVLYTDGLGKITNETVVGNYYKFVVNNIPGTQSGDAEQTWQSNDAATTVYMYILTPSTPYEWNAYYNQVENNVTVVYSDSVTPSSVTVTITDLKTNLQVVSQTYTATQSFTYNYHDLTGMGSYQVNILINRLGSQTRDQRMITSSKTFGITMPVDIYIVYALSTLFLMIMAGLFSYANSRRGAFAVVIVAVILMYFGLLPWTMITVAMLAAIFAVMSLFASRVQ